MLGRKTAKSGVSGAIGPSSRMTRLTIARAGLPVEDVGDRGLPGLGRRERGAVERGHLGLLAEEIGGADLHAGGAEHEGGRDSPAVGDAAGGNHRDVDGIDDLRDERHRADHPGLGLPGKGSAMPAGLDALGDDGVDALPDQDPGFARIGRRTQDQAADLAETIDEDPVRQAEVEAHDTGSDPNDDVAHRLIEGQRLG